jgi:hypothetical protein
MMPWIREKLRAPPGIDGTVEDVRHDAREQSRVIGAENANL